MDPVIALVGQPNVGKSTMFNRLTRSRAALVADQPGLTRDRIYGAGKVGGRPYIVIDTGGLTGDAEGVEAQMAGQSYRAMEEADAILFLVDGRKGLTAIDESVAAHLRRLGKPVFLVVNKTEGMETDIVTAEFQALALGMPHAASAAHGDGVDELMDVVLAAFPAEGEMQRQDTASGIKVAVIGRPNVGKSTLVNRMLGEERVVVFDEAGTTRDSIYIPLERDEQHYTLIDTAGVRRRGRVTEMIEKFSIVKTLQAIEDANVVILVLDASTGISAQDTHLAGFILESGRALVIAVNKWDGLPQDQRERIKQEIDRKFPFLAFATIHFISALHGTGVGHLFDSVRQAYESATAKFATPKLTRLLQDAVTQNQPPLVKGRRIKLRYAHQGGDNPPIIVIHGNQTDDVPDSYRRYLSNIFRKALGLEGTPVRIEFRSGENPYKDKKQTLTKRQQDKRRRQKRRMQKKFG